MLYKGTDKIQDIYFGTIPISKVYNGSTLVFEKDPAAPGVKLTLNRYIPAADMTCPHVIYNYNTGRNSISYKWKTALPAGTYTFRFNTDGNTEADTVTCTIDDTDKQILEWSEGSDMKTQIYVSTTQLYIEYKYAYRIATGDSTRYSTYANKYITTVERI